MAVLVGIDEAGFGPILGPLVVSSSTLSLPRELLDSDLWQILKRSVGKRRKQLSGRLLIADSKKAHNKYIGIKHLERAVLACLKCLNKEPTTLSELITLICPELLARLSEYPWYKEIGIQKLSVCQADIAIASAVLADDMALNGIKLLDIRSCCLDVAYYNRMMSCVKNKASVLFTATSQLIKNALENFADNDLHIYIDRQGGRIRYRNKLQLMFPNIHLRILCENQEISSYEFKLNDKMVRLHFVVNADGRFLPVSLASMVSKYLRELFIYNINRYFIGFSSDLKPTAGYWKDGLRFIGDLRTNLPELRFDKDQLIRCR